jgi:three-Cys-motif partner protein
VTKPHRGKSRLHKDEVSALEGRRQTVHKLLLIRDYGGACTGIVAQRSRRTQQRLDITLADVYAGAGQHRSAADPDGVSKGTALLFSTIGRDIQRAHPLVRVHVRLNDLDSGVVKRLRQRVEHYRVGGSPSDCVDINVTDHDASDEMIRIAREAANRRGFLLLLVDPFGMPPAFETLNEVSRVAGWHEMIINLDISGLFRLRAVAQLDVAEHELLSQADEIRLDRVFGNSSWRVAYDSKQVWSPEALERLARTYAERFKGRYAVRDVYRLWSTGNQIRCIVHLAPHIKARETFRDCYERTRRAGLFQGKRLNDADRATYAFQLFDALRGTTTSLEEIFAAGLLPLDRGRLKDVLRTAEDRGCGTLHGESLEWFAERVVPEPFKPAQLDLDLGA